MHDLLEQAVADAAPPALADLFVDDSVHVGVDGNQACGRRAIVDQYAALWGTGAQLRIKTLSVHIAGDVALMTSEWCAELAGPEPAAWGISTEVARRCSDGSWRFAVDAPGLVAWAAPGETGGVVCGRMPRC